MKILIRKNRAGLEFQNVTDRAKLNGWDENLWKNTQFWHIKYFGGILATDLFEYKPGEQFSL